jgi:transcriptional regulator with XRE-family HTH domain
MFVSELGQLIKIERLARKWSLRQLASLLGVTPAYVADIEANRRFPSAELRQRMSAVLEIPPDKLAAADYRLSPDLRDWIEERPQLITFLRLLQASPVSDMLIQRLTRFIKRRPRPQIPRGFLVTWESELRAIAAEASAWSVETGGDLFGRWNELPTVFLATRAGPNAQRDNAHFRLDVEYLRDLSETLAADWALRYFGDWHSHHRLGLSAPSAGDRKRILQVASRNEFPGMTEMIVTLEDSGNAPAIRVYPWVYDLSSENSRPLPLRIRVLPGLSPIRQALLTRRALPEQELFAWEKVSLHRIRIGSDATPPILEPTGEVDSITRERVLSQLSEALREASGSSVEHHTTGFGCVLVANLDKEYYLAFALAAAWPMTVLEVHRLDRDAGSTEPINTPPGLVASDIPGILGVFQSGRATAKGINHVDA